eukprot:Sspe_Gene.2751::Locus_914_Transcript_2_2_Confidence_0.750_Length_1620::g.2751::m.2751
MHPGCLLHASCCSTVGHGSCTHTACGDAFGSHLHSSSLSQHRSPSNFAHGCCSHALFPASHTHAASPWHAVLSVYAHVFSRHFSGAVELHADTAHSHNGSALHAGSVPCTHGSFSHLLPVLPDALRGVRDARRLRRVAARLLLARLVLVVPHAPLRVLLADVLGRVCALLLLPAPRRRRVPLAKVLRVLLAVQLVAVPRARRVRARPLPHVPDAPRVGRAVVRVCVVRARVVHAPGRPAPALPRPPGRRLLCDQVSPRPVRVADVPEHLLLDLVHLQVLEVVVVQVARDRVQRRLRIPVLLRVRRLLPHHHPERLHLLLVQHLPRGGQLLRVVDLPVRDDDQHPL